MSDLKSSMFGLAETIRGKTGETAQMSIAEMTTRVSEIFPAFYFYGNGDGSTLMTFEQVPFEIDLVSIMFRWGIGSLKKNEVYSVFYNGATEDSRYRKKADNNIPYNVSNTVVVTSTADGNGTYTIKIKCDDCTFTANDPYVVFLARKVDT